ncbi:MAG: chromosome segregation protein SMC [Actinomyces sp.]|nr:MAG: chromosome segregation protein SMC [Actinomyces sp.]
MYLKNLTLKGFKSFADTTSIDLEPGVTVVVGPNGSGKSNVVDAIAWVLGAQAPSAVRSQKMDDVIFAGTSSRPPLGRAEVSLTIDNASGTLPVEFTEVTITRTLFRTGESEYAINGVPCRLLDITELLSDGGVGRQQHVIVSQGQIDAVLNARPEERRAIIEEAAGILKFRKRKERAERRLAATDTDLTRVKDLLREVRRQLRPLERQAEAARRHGDLVAELEALRLHLAGREIADLREELRRRGDERSELARAEHTLDARLATVTAALERDELELARHGGDDLGDTLVRLEATRERARGLAALLTERRRGLERERAAVTDRGVIANLEAEAERLRRELEEVTAAARALAPEHERLAAAEERLAADRAAFAERWGDGVPVPSGQAAEVRGRLAALHAGLERGRAERARVAERLDHLAARRGDIEAAVGRHRAEIGRLHDSEEPLVAALEAATDRERRAAGTVAAATDAHAEAVSELDRWTARAEALALALDSARARAGSDRLGDLDGMLGSLLDLVEVDAGWEAAFESAVGDALAAVVVADPDVARRALERLTAEGEAGAVLALGASGAGTPRADGPGEALRRHVRGLAPGVDALLDVLLHDAVVVDGDWTAAVDVALAHPDLVVVTRGGDRFAAGTWRLGQGATGATGAALAEAEARVAELQEQVADAAARLGVARTELEAARAERERLAAELATVDDGLTAASEALQRLDADRRELASEIEALTERASELDLRLERESEQARQLEAELPRLEADEEQLLAEGRQLAAARAELEERATAVGALRTDLEVRAAGLDERRQFLSRRLAEIDARLERDAAEREAASERRLALDRRQAVLERLAATVASVIETVEGHLAVVRESRRRQSEAAQAIARRLDEQRRTRARLQADLDDIRQRHQKAEIGEAEVRTRLVTAVERLRDEHRVTPEVAVSAPCPPLDPDTTPEQRLRGLESELEIMGPVNPLALEEYQALQERVTFLQGQLDDIRTSRRELTRVIRSIDEEIVSVFAGAFADVAVNFEQLFSTLFPGGEGSLRLTDPDDLLDTGVEISARPSGKNVRKLSLLSGGERSLTALAFLFAVFRSRPSPFYVMDEVEAALDDVNLHRFLALVEEFRADAQLVLVSHQKRTMEAADCLYGVTMKPGGSSRVVAEKVTEDARTTPANPRR